MKISKSVGLLASVGSMALWMILIFYNPYTHQRAESDVLFTTLFFLFFPACAALAATMFKNPALMLIAFVWSVPVSLYLSMTPGIFKWFGMTSALYLVSGILMMVRNKRSPLR